MTVSYSADVATAGWGFLKLLTRWEGSIYRLLRFEFPIYLFAFYFLSLIYRFALNDYHKENFQFVAEHCHVFISSKPLAFVLGFFISLVMQRWSYLLRTIPWPDRMAMFVTANVRGHDDKVRLMRRTMMRYMCLAYLITISSVSPGVKKKYPKFRNMVEAGFMLENELQVLNSIKAKDNKYFVPLAWCTALVSRAREEGKVKDDFALKTLVDEINQFRGQLASLFVFDWIPLPLVYTQVVTIAVYSYFIPALLCNQFRFGKDNSVLYQDWFPIFTFLEFFFYMGWLKVGESFINPFGNDDDDIDFDTLIDRGFRVSYMIVDEMHNEHPELIKDNYWDTTFIESPHPAPQPRIRKSSFLGSALDLQLKASNKRRLSKYQSDDERSNYGPGSDTEGGRRPSDSRFLKVTRRQHSTSSDQRKQSVQHKDSVESIENDDRFVKHEPFKHSNSTPIEIVITESELYDGKMKKNLEPLIEGDEHSPTPPTSRSQNMVNKAGPTDSNPDSISF